MWMPSDQADGPELGIVRRPRPRFYPDQIRWGGRPSSGTAFFPELQRLSEAVVFPYRCAGQVVNWKAAAFPVKAFTSKKGGKLQFFNLERVIGSETVFITEGEWDAAALVEAGIAVEQVLSVPNGAREKTRDAELRGYDYVEEALRAGLGRVKRFV